MEKFVEFIVIICGYFFLRIHLEMMKMNRKDAVLSAEMWLQGKHFKVYITFLHSMTGKSCFAIFEPVKNCIQINLLIQKHRQQIFTRHRLQNN